MKEIEKFSEKVAADESSAPAPQSPGKPMNPTEKLLSVSPINLDPSKEFHSMIDGACIEYTFPQKNISAYNIKKKTHLFPFFLRLFISFTTHFLLLCVYILSTILLFHFSMFIHLFSTMMPFTHSRTF